MDYEPVKDTELARCWCPRCMEYFDCVVSDRESLIKLEDGSVVFEHLHCVIQGMFDKANKRVNYGRQSS